MNEQKESMGMNVRVRLTSRLRRLAGLAIATAALCALLASPAAAASPKLEIGTLATPTNFVPGDTENDYLYEVRIQNAGAAPTDGSPVTIASTLPEGLTVKKVKFTVRVSREFVVEPGGVDVGAFLCADDEPAASVTVTCTLPGEPLFPGADSVPSVIFPEEELLLQIFVSPAGAAEGEALEATSVVEGGGSPVDATTFEHEASATPAPPGLAEFSATVTDADGQPVTQAGARPYAYTTAYSLRTERKPPSPDGQDIFAAGGDPRDVRVQLPPGLLADPTALPRCKLEDFSRGVEEEPFRPEGIGGLQAHPDCPDDSMVGLIVPRRVNLPGNQPFPIYNLEPPPGQPAQFGFAIVHYPYFIDTQVRNGSDYGVDAVLRNINQVRGPLTARVTFWGTPTGALHDGIRGKCLNQLTGIAPINAVGSCPAEVEPQPSWRLPTGCGTPMDQTMLMRLWLGSSVERTSPASAAVGCNQLDFEPELKARPTTDVADAPTGLDLDLEIPQNDDPEALATADLKKAVVTLPEGISLNPAGANGLASCSPSDIGLTSAVGETPVTFSPGPARCPDAARIGRAEVVSPLLDHTLNGGVYVATPDENPFGSLLAIYIAVNDRAAGVNLKLPGRVIADSRTGRLKTVFDRNPQQPVENVRLSLFGGPLAALRTPAVCDTYSTESSLTPWSAPESGPPATPSDTYSISKSPGEGSCARSDAARPNRPAFDAGTVAPVAKAYSPFVLRLSRDDGSQEFSKVSISPPPGLLARLAGIPYCSEPTLALAASRPGREEEDSPSCPAASRLGSVHVAAGSGPAPYHARGDAYLTGPYKGAPLGLALVTPATAGPYDLGTVVVRVALHIDSATARITADSDPIPRILEGIPLDVRSATISIDRPGFTFNPTSCDPFAVEGLETSTLGQAAILSSRFQVGECGRLGFKPRMALRLKGGTKRGKNPKLIATVAARGGDANLSRVAVRLPRSAFLDQGHIRTVCTRVQFAADACPPGSVYGRAWVKTPLVDYTLSGPVYLRSSNNKLPDLVIALRGPAHQPVRVELVGRTDSVKGALRNVFSLVPDAPFTRARVELFGGRRGLVVNSRDICARKYRAAVRLNGQNGRVSELRPVVRGNCGKRRGQRPQRGKRRRAAR